MIYASRLLDIVRDTVRRYMNRLAQLIHKLSGGRISPNSITLFGLFAHIPIAWLIATRHNIRAAVLLVIFGLFDALDGSLARLQNKASNSGMLLDASTDRMKEVMLYSGAAYALIASGYSYWAVWAVTACGASLVVSYVKAKGETAVAGGKLTANQVNRLFQDGLMRFEVRMFFLVVGLLTNHLRFAVVAIAILASITAVSRLRAIMKKL
ncbi:MAG TPA: CDP-alcohol phosphatidyltransferase family protein [Candidatus Saccharibacteria bacterium]|nr:CDP-alcohol phosphatidyltransferase family protein [Candidatus Saccharibacteria bacterium]